MLKGWYLLLIQTIVFFSLYSCLFLLMLNQMNQLRREINFLNESNYIPPDPALGYEIKRLFPLPQSMINSPGLIIFSAPRCPHCHTKLEAFLDLEEQFGKIPTLIILLDDIDHTKRFLEKYNPFFTINISTFEKMHNELGVERFPTFMLIDETSRIIDVLPPNELIAYNAYVSYIKQTKNFKKLKEIRIVF